MAKFLCNSKLNADVIVTRHAALVEWLAAHFDGRVIEAIDEIAAMNLCNDNYPIPVLAHATADDLKDKRIVGVLPLHLAAVAHRVTEIPLNIPAPMRGRELTLEEMEEVAGDPVTYCVERTDFEA